MWNPVHFQAELDLVVEEIKKIRARHVILGTVPHVTIAPIARGVGSKVRKGSRYYPYYTRPWISTEDFDVGRDPHVTEQEARAGVEFYLGDGKTGRTGPVRVDFGRLISRDTLISSPPRSLDSDLRLIAWADEVLDGILDRLLL